MSGSSGRTIDKITSSIGSIFQMKPSTSRRESNSSRRERIPDKPKNTSSSVWSILKNYSGKDLAQIPLPVNFSEPLSTLQRLTEDFEYSTLLDTAAKIQCPYEQLAYVAVFVISGYGSSTRTTKPFNPLLGETYEFDRMDDLGWRSIAEKVSHRPPQVAQYCESSNWTLRQEYNIEFKLTGKDIQIAPQGISAIEFKGGSSYFWNKVETVVHNFLLGNLWVDLSGEVKIIGKKNTEGITCDIRFFPYSWRSRDEFRKVEGKVLDANGTVKWIIEGTWDHHVQIIPTSSNDKVVQEPEKRQIWKLCDQPEGSQQFYSFSTFACQLNEPEVGIAPTDSRLRPDQRLMEDGKWDEANQLKNSLEEKQRNNLKERSEKEQMAAQKGISRNPYQPIWFNVRRKQNGQLEHVYNGNYWKCKEKQDWSKCPDIFS